MRTSLGGVEGHSWKSRTRTSLWLPKLCAGLLSAIPISSLAAFSCGGILAPHESAWDQVFTPRYDARLSKLTIATGEFSKQLTAQQQQALEKRGPFIAASTVLNAADAAMLKTTLNKSASVGVPNWLVSATANVGGVLVPGPWVGMSVEALAQLIASATADAQLKAANLAGTVTAGGKLAVVERVAKDAKGASRFIWVYIYQYTLNQQTYVAPLAVCSADVVTP